MVIKSTEAEELHWRSRAQDAVLARQGVLI